MKAVITITAIIAGLFVAAVFIPILTGLFIDWIRVQWQKIREYFTPAEVDSKVIKMDVTEKFYHEL